MHLREVANAPFYLKGVTDILGIEIPVIDLGKQLSDNQWLEEPQSHSCIVIVIDPTKKDGKPHLALLADALTGVKSIYPEEAKKLTLQAQKPHLADLCHSYQHPDKHLSSQQLQELILQQSSEAPVLFVPMNHPHSDS